MSDHSAVYEHEGAIGKLRDIVARDSPRHILLVTGKTSYDACGARAAIDGALRSYAYTRFFDFEENPQEHDIMHGAHIYQHHACDYIVAIGGGSAIDMAKMINIAAGYQGDLQDFATSDNIRYKNAKLIAIPTTAGTGSEATQFAVYYCHGVKHSADKALLLPDIALVDPNLTRSMSPYTTATTGMDALSQAMESYWSIHSTERSRRYAQEAMSLAWKYLPAAVQNDPHARVEMSRAALLSGKAINLTRTTAPHAVSYAFTSHFGLPHGHALCMTLADFMLFNYRVDANTCNDVRGHVFVKKRIEDIARIVGCATVQEAAQALRRFMARIGIDANACSVLHTAEDRQLIVENVNIQRLANNPRALSSGDLTRLLQST